MTAYSEVLTALVAGVVGAIGMWVVARTNKKPDSQEQHVRRLMDDNARLDNANTKLREQLDEIRGEVSLLRDDIDEARAEIRALRTAAGTAP